MYDVQFTRAASRELRKLPVAVRKRVIVAVRSLSQEPRPATSTKLVNRATAWRIRVGDYRVIYDIFDEVLVVSVIRVAHRREVYRP